MNQRAFNLFTALVAFVLIMLTVLMVNTMTRTEERSIATIADLQQQSEMQTIADLARGDAFQVFVFQLRRRMENYFNQGCDLPSGCTTYIPLKAGLNWDEILKDFQCSNFGGSACGVNSQDLASANAQCNSTPTANCSATSVTINGISFECTQIATGCVARTISGSKALSNFSENQIGGLLSGGDVFSRYSLTLDYLGEDPATAYKNFGNAIEKSITISNPNDPAQQLFELVDCDYDDSAKKSRCPNGSFYIHFRFGQIDPQTYEALPRIKVTDLSITGQELTTGIIPQSDLKVYVPLRVFQALAQAKQIADNTVFTTQVTNELSNMKIGLCNQNSCKSIITDPLLHTTKEPRNVGCAGSIRAGTGPTIPTPGQQTMGTSGISFNPNNSLDMKNKLREYAKQYLCALPAAQWAASGTSDGLVPTTVPIPAGNNCVFSNTALQTPEVSRPIKLSTGDPAGNGYCVSFLGGNQTYISLEFNETNPIYKVDNTKDSRYRIRIYPELTSNAPANLRPCTTTCTVPPLSTACSIPYGCS